MKIERSLDLTFFFDNGIFRLNQILRKNEVQFALCMVPPFAGRASIWQQYE